MQYKKWRNKLIVVLIVLLIILGIVVVTRNDDTESNQEATEETTEIDEDTKEEAKEKAEKITEEENEDKEVKQNTDDEETKGEAADEPPEIMSSEEAQNLIPTTDDGEYQKDERFEDGDITCSELSVFSGQFVEDGRDELVENVAAIKVKNNSDEYLDLASMVYEIDGETATFVATGLPSGKTAWVMEKSRKKVNADSKLIYKGSTTAFRSDVVSSTDKIDVSVNGNMMKVTNKSKKDMEMIVVYYKVLHEDGNYFGGITYMKDFQDVKSGESKEAMAGHYKEGTTEIVRIDWR